jgi:WD40 repeat protein
MNKVTMVLPALVLFAAASLHAQMSHSEQVEDVAFSADGKTLASISVSELKFWDVESGVLKQTVTPGGVFVRFLGTGLDVIASSTESIRRISSENGTVQTTFRETLYRKFKTNPAISPDGVSIAALELREGGTYMIWLDAATGSVQKEQKITAFANSGVEWLLEFAPDGKDLYAVVFDKIRVIHPDGSIQELAADLQGLNGVFVGKSRYAIANQKFCTINMIGTAPRPENMFWEKKGIHFYKDIALHPHNESIAAVASFTTLNVYDRSTGKSKIVPTTKEANRSIAYSPDGTLIAVGMGFTKHQGTKESFVKLFDAKTLKLVKVLLPPKE